MSPRALALLTALLATACKPADTGPVSPYDYGPERNIHTVFLLLMENKNWAQIEGSDRAPYINDTLLPESSYALAYEGPGVHPSEPNYIWLEAGDNLGVRNDLGPSANHQATTDHLVTQLEAAGFDWTSYQQGIDGLTCPLRSDGDYAPKHNPMVFFDDVTDTNDPQSARCLEHERPLEELQTDLAADTVAPYVFVTPDLCHDMHDSCEPTNDSIQQGDDWLAQWIPKITASQAYQDGGALIVTWDESEVTGACPLAQCPIGLIVMSPLGKGGGYTNEIAYTHSSTLRTVETIFDVPPLRDAGYAVDLGDLFETFP